MDRLHAIFILKTLEELRMGALEKGEAKAELEPKLRPHSVEDWALYLEQVGHPKAAAELREVMK